jgi:hypothetical protein
MTHDHKFNRNFNNIFKSIPILYDKGEFTEIYLEMLLAMK